MVSLRKINKNKNILSVCTSTACTELACSEHLSKRSTQCDIKSFVSLSLSKTRNARRIMFSALRQPVLS
jgi:hypothetical protein